MPESSLTPSERSMRARAASHASWAKCPDRSARTAAARAARDRQFEQAVDPDGVLSEEERQRRAESARRQHMVTMGLRSAQARRARRAGRA